MDPCVALRFPSTAPAANREYRHAAQQRAAQERTRAKDDCLRQPVFVFSRIRRGMALSRKAVGTTLILHHTTQYNQAKHLPHYQAITRFKLTIVTIASLSERLAIANISYSIIIVELIANTFFGGLLV